MWQVDHADALLSQTTTQLVPKLFIAIQLKLLVASIIMRLAIEAIPDAKLYLIFVKSNLLNRSSYHRC